VKEASKNSVFVDEIFSVLTDWGTGGDLGLRRDGSSPCRLHLPFQGRISFSFSWCCTSCFVITNAARVSSSVFVHLGQ
jgi:hypothetical protein